MPDLDLIKQAKQGMRAFGRAYPAALWRVDDDHNQSGWFAADLLQEQQTPSKISRPTFAHRESLDFKPRRGSDIRSVRVGRAHLCCYWSADALRRFRTLAAA